MSAYDLWQELRTLGWAALSQWRVDQKPEGLYLDFKAANPGGNGEPSEDDKKNLARNLSGFGNIDGGVLVYGAVTTKDSSGQDVLHQLPGVTQLAAYTERLRSLVRGCTTPPIPGVEVFPLEDAPGSDRGAVVIYVPFSDAGPYRAEGPSSVKERYFMRTTTDTVVMPHQILAAMFGRRPLPNLRVGLERDSDGRTAIVHVENRGKGAAQAVFVRFMFDHSGNSRSRGSWHDKRNDVSFRGWKVAFALSSDEWIYPGETRNPGTFDLPGDREVTARVDCANAPPNEVQQLATLEQGKVLWFEPPE